MEREQVAGLPVPLELEPDAGEGPSQVPRDKRRELRRVAHELRGVLDTLTMEEVAAVMRESELGCWLVIAGACVVSGTGAKLGAVFQRAASNG